MSASLEIINVEEGDQNPGADAADWEAQLKNRIMQFFISVGVIMIAMFSSAMPVFGEIKRHHTILWPIWGLSSMITVLSGFILIALLMCSPNHFHHPLLTLFIFLAGLALAASYCSLLFLVKVNAFIAIIVPLQKFAVVAVIAYSGTRLHGDDGFIDNDEDYESEMESGFELSKLSNTPAFAVQTALILGYLKKTSASTSSDLAVTYFASMLCLCSMMITCMPLRFSFSGMKHCLLAVVRILNFAMLVMLAWIATTLAAKFLEGMVVLSFSLLLIASASFLLWRFRQRDPPVVAGEGSNWLCDAMKDNKNIFIGSMAASYYTILVLVYLNFLGEQIDSLVVKLFVFVVVTAIMSGLALTPFTLKSPSPEVSSIVAKIMVSFAGLLVLIVCVMVVYAEIKLL